MFKRKQNNKVSRPTANGHLVDLRQVVKVYESAAGRFVALQDVDLQVKSGEFVSIVGKSGSGKSTLINVLTGIDRPTSGEVWVAGIAVHTLTEEQIAIWRGRAVGVIFQFFQLLPTLTAVENVMLPMDYAAMLPAAAIRNATMQRQSGKRTSRAERAERALHLLEQVGMAEVAHELPSALSGGQQQSVAIARALANDPPIITADEPTGNLDSKTTELVFRLFQDLVDEGKTILMVTHDDDLAARARRTVVLADGEIVEEKVNSCPTL